MDARSGAIGLRDVAEHRSAGLGKAVLKSGSPDCARTTVEETSKTSRAAHLEGVLEKCPVDDLGRTPAFAGANGLDDRDVRRVGGVHGLMAGGVELSNHPFYAREERLVLGGGENIAVLTENEARREWRRTVTRTWSAAPLNDRACPRTSRRRGASPTCVRRATLTRCMSWA